MAGQPAPARPRGPTSPTAVPGGMRFSSLNTGYLETCGLAGGVAYCWGANGDYLQSSPGYLGGPYFQPISASEPFVALTTGPGGEHTCGLAASGTSYCWGLNNFGQLGDGTTASRVAPQAVPGLTFASMTAGDVHSCGVSSTGTAYCWGDNLFGELGIGIPTGAAYKLSPVPVVGGINFITVVAGAFYSCGIASGGSVYCWGDNSYGQSGNGTIGNATGTTGTYVPVLVQ